MKEHVASAGICLSIVGVLLVYWFSPLNESVIDGGTADTDGTALERASQRKNFWMRAGVALVVFGSVVQLIANYIPS